ncbi:MAG: ubiquinone/menaquinone biosynthesis methyltransferase [Chloroflexota bacterium]
MTSRPLYTMFMAVPPRYDIVNHIVTLGLDIGWRNLAARECLAAGAKTFLDLGCGTGDLALTVSRTAAGTAAIVGLDYSRPMLDRAVIKARRRHAVANFIQGDAAALPFPDSSLECVGISFAFRNLTYKNPNTRQYLSEVLRVLRPGGRFVIVESSQPPSAIFNWIFQRYVRWFVRPAGVIVSGNPGAYRYLSESVARFYTATEAVKLLLDAGFSQVTFRRLFFGAAALHIAVK